MRLATCIVLLICMVIVNGCASGEKAPAAMDSATDAIQDLAEPAVAAAEGGLGEIPDVNVPGKWHVPPAQKEEQPDSPANRPIDLLSPVR